MGDYIDPVTQGRIYEKKAKEILKKEFDEVEYIGKKRKIYDYICIKDSKKYNVEIKFSKGTCFTIFPKELEADILILYLGDNPFIFRKFNDGIFR